MWVKNLFYCALLLWLENKFIDWDSIKVIVLLLLLLFNSPSVCEVCPNDEVGKPQTGTSLGLDSVAYFYVTILYAPPHILSFVDQCPPEGETNSLYSSSHTITVQPVFTHIGSYSHPGVPCLCPSMLKILHLHCRSLIGVLRSGNSCDRRWIQICDYIVNELCYFSVVNGN